MTRTFSVEYLGRLAAMDSGDLFDEVVEVFEKYGLKVEGGSDGPTDDTPAPSGVEVEEA